MLCTNLNCLFVHIPKTGGQSIAHALLRHLGLDWEQRARFLMRPNDDPARGPERLAHLTASEYVEFGYLSQSEFDSLFKFSIVRNPWDRLVSEYRYRGYAERQDFRTFVREGLPAPGWGDPYRHILPQRDFLFGAGGQLLVDRVLRFEQLAEEADELLAQLGLEDRSLPWVNASGSGTPDAVPPYADYYDDESRALVAELYHADIEAFAYEFGD